MKRRLLCFLAATAYASAFFCAPAECRYHIGIEGCESGHIQAVAPQLFCGGIRPLARLYLQEACSFSGNLMEAPNPDLYYVCGPAGEYSVQMGQDDGPLHYLPARVTIPAGEAGDGFTVSLRGEKNTTGISIYRREDFARAYPRGYFLNKGEREAAAPLPVQAEAQGNRLEATLPFGVYMVAERRTPTDADESAETLYALNVLPR